MFKRVFATDPPKTVTLLKGIACFGENPSRIMYVGTRMPPPPTPPPAAIYGKQNEHEKVISDRLPEG
jgi:hypothetical protein